MSLGGDVMSLSQEGIKVIDERRCVGSHEGLVSKRCAET